jgi:hypothetical protein
MKGDQERCLAAGMGGYVSMPINAQTLSSAISQVLKALPPLTVPSDESLPGLAVAIDAKASDPALDLYLILPASAQIFGKTDPIQRLDGLSSSIQQLWRSFLQTPVLDSQGPL